jgi:hypothetical protein
MPPARHARQRQEGKLDELGIGPYFVRILALDAKARKRLPACAVALVFQHADEVYLAIRQLAHPRVAAV